MGVSEAGEVSSLSLRQSSVHWRLRDWISEGESSHSAVGGARREWYDRPMVPMRRGLKTWEEVAMVSEVGEMLLGGLRLG